MGKSAHREIQEAVQAAYDKGRAEALDEAFAELVRLLSLPLSPQEIERAFAEKFFGAEEKTE